MFPDPGILRGGIAVLLVVLVLATGCGSTGKADLGADVVPTKGPEVTLDAKDDGRQIQVEQGQLLIITLESNPTTGYRWEVTESQEPVLRQAGEAEFQAQSDLIGASGVETFRFEAAGPGEATLKLIYHRSWEKDVDPLETFSVQVVVR